MQFSGTSIICSHREQSNPAREKAGLHLKQRGAETPGGSSARHSKQRGGYTIFHKLSVQARVSVESLQDK